MKYTAVAALAFGLAAAPALAQDTEAEVTDADAARIQQMLAGMGCSMNDENIEKDDEGFGLYEVKCADGQFEISLSPSFEMVEKTAE